MDGELRESFPSQAERLGVEEGRQHGESEALPMSIKATTTPLTRRLPR
jgi:hypothetical protein